MSRRITDRDMREAFAAAANIERMYTAAAQTDTLRRVNEHGYNGLTAAALEQAVTSSGHSDPTAAAALAGLSSQVSDASLIAAWRRLTAAVEARMPHLTRTTSPSVEEARSTDVQFDADAVFRPGEGVCAACGRHFPGGKHERDQVRAVPRSEGRLLCWSHRTGFSNSRDPIDRYCERIRLHWSTEQIGGDAA